MGPYVYFEVLFHKFIKIDSFFYYSIAKTAFRLMNTKEVVKLTTLSVGFLAGISPSANIGLCTGIACAKERSV